MSEVDVSRLKEWATKGPEAETLPCIVCGTQLHNAVGKRADEYGEFCNQPGGGLAFYSYGHYGSTVFDPYPNLDRARVEISVCDSCIRLHVHLGRVVFTIIPEYPMRIRVGAESVDADI